MYSKAGVLSLFFLRPPPQRARKTPGPSGGGGRGALRARGGTLRQRCSLTSISVSAPHCSQLQGSWGAQGFSPTLLPASAPWGALGLMASAQHHSPLQALGLRGLGFISRPAPKRACGPPGGYRPPA